MSREITEKFGVEEVEKEKLTLTVEEAAEVLGISRPTAYEAIKTGALPYIRIGRRIIIPIAALEKLLANAGSKG